MAYIRKIYTANDLLWTIDNLMCGPIC